jgi:hypothetical protein
MNNSVAEYGRKVLHCQGNDGIASQFYRQEI